MEDQNQKTEKKKKGKIRYNEQGVLLVSRGMDFNAKLYKRYKIRATLLQRPIYELINEAMEKYLPDLDEKYPEKLKRIGQAELDL